MILMLIKLHQMSGSQSGRNRTINKEKFQHRQGLYNMFFEMGVEGKKKLRTI